MKRFDAETLERLRLILEGRVAEELDATALRRAAVLIPLFEQHDGWNLVFARRSEMLRVHKGQIAFPGGSLDPGESVEQAAIRECEEEIGIPRDEIALIGRLDDIETHTGFVVAPIVGVLDRRHDYLMHPHEVTEIIEVPIEALLDPANPRLRYVDFQGKKWPSYSFVYGEWEIWGMTAHVVKMFLDIVRRAL